MDPITEAIFRGEMSEITPHTAVLFWLKEQLNTQKQKVSIRVDANHISFIIQ